MTVRFVRASNEAVAALALCIVNKHYFKHGVKVERKGRALMLSVTAEPGTLRVVDTLTYLMGVIAGIEHTASMSVAVPHSDEWLSGSDGALPEGSNEAMLEMLDATAAKI